MSTWFLVYAYTTSNPRAPNLTWQRSLPAKLRSSHLLLHCMTRDIPHHTTAILEVAAISRNRSRAIRPQSILGRGEISIEISILPHSNKALNSIFGFIMRVILPMARTSMLAAEHTSACRLRKLTGQTSTQGDCCRCGGLSAYSRKLSIQFLRLLERDFFFLEKSAWYQSYRMPPSKLDTGKGFEPTTKKSP